MNGHKVNDLIEDLKDRVALYGSDSHEMKKLKVKLGQYQRAASLWAFETCESHYPD